MYQALMQVKAYARIDGAILALVWGVSFVFTVLAPQQIIGALLAFATPFVVGWRLHHFRTRILDGYISFRRAIAFCLFTFIYASLAFALIQFLYFQFLDGGNMMALFADSIKKITPVYQSMGMSLDEINQTTNLIQSYTPIELTILFMIQNLIVGFGLSVPIAIIGAKHRNMPNP